MVFFEKDQGVVREDGEFYLLYEPKDILGDGISSVVRRCIHKETGEEYAVKVIDKFCKRCESVKGIDVVRQFHTEVSILNRLKGHPYIISLKDSFESSAFMYLVLELAKGGELFDYLTKEVTISEKLSRKFLWQLLQAVKGIHDEGIVHRDIKPENILLDEDNNVILSDFGFGAITTNAQPLFEILGTPSYFAPEVLRCLVLEDPQGYGSAVDLWACGVILYTLLVGQGPFWHRKDTVMYRNIMEGSFKFQSPEWDDISEGPKDLIRKLLVVDPQQRYTADEALSHPWFKVLSCSDIKLKAEHPKLKLKVLVYAVLTMKRLYYTYHERHAPMTYKTVLNNPYNFKEIRKIIDSCTFNMYGHWVKRTPDQAQNRGALFANSLKRELVKADVVDGFIPLIPMLYSHELTQSFIPRRPSFIKNSSSNSLDKYTSNHSGKMDAPSNNRPNSLLNN
ncbi:phosphorylase b kinase gamma catalytic chain, skeletal muscle/heart isoform isoform X2 [Hydra vulgaris]|uniref:phosphorylase kinase n=1 Tax=Hydra vulgaris TaxID=6087 RepID=A0ABM4CP56_HYDVU